MKLSAREDIEAPIDHVFDRVGDFALLERSAMRRGVEVVRNVVEGKTTWALAFTFRGRARNAPVTLEKVESPSLLVASFSSGGLAGKAALYFHDPTTWLIFFYKPKQTRLLHFKTRYIFQLNRRNDFFISHCLFRRRDIVLYVLWN